MRPTLALPLLLVASTQGGCLSALTAKSFQNRDFQGQYDHYVDFYTAQTETIRTHYGCAEAARYLNDALDDRAPRQIPSSMRADLKSDFQLESELLVETCMEEEFPRLKEDFDAKRTTRFFTELADLPLSENIKADLERRAKAVGVVEAAAMAKKADAAWQEGRYAEAISLYDSAAYKSRSQSKATAAEKKEFADKAAAKRAERARMLVESARKNASNPKTEHIALLELSRAMQLGDDSVKRERDALWKKLRAAATYRVQVDLTGEGPVALVREQLQARSWRTPLIFTTGGARVQGRLAAVDIAEQSSPGRDSRQKKVGTRMVDNPDHGKLVQVVNAWQRCVNETRASLAKDPSRCGGTWWGPCYGPSRNGCIGDPATQARWNREGLAVFQSKLDGFRNQLASTPSQVEEDVTEPVYFATTEYVWTATSSLEVSVASAGGSPRSEKVPLRTRRKDASRGAVPEVGLSAYTAKPPPRSAHEEDIAKEAYAWVADWITKDSASHATKLKKQGDRGAILYFVLTGSSDRELDERLRAATGIPDASSLVRRGP